MNEEQYAKTFADQQLQQQAGMNSLQTQQQLLLQEQEKGLAEEQLDVEDIIDRIHNLLQGKEYKDTGGGEKEWVEPKSNQLRVLSDWGVQRIMQTIRFHINKNKLLSNFNEEQINRLMYQFTTEMNDLILLKYQRLFREPNFEECKQILEKRLKEKENLKVFAQELVGQTPDKEKIQKELLKELEGRLEYEIKKIKQDELKERLKEYGLLSWEIEQSIYDTYNRAYGGKERDTLRKHASFSEIRAIQPEIQKKGGAFGWLKG